ncbi:hypothetical protein EC991_000174 [Linnemannia zychae]|nr:hypothetical protein EC991_000174 [Linnemannia zychae]
MTNQPTDNPPPSGKMTTKGKTVFNKLRNSAKRALHPSSKDDYSTTFTQNIPKPVFRVALPKKGDRFTSTLQLAFGQYLLSKYPLPSVPTSELLVTSGNYVQELELVLDEAEEAWRSNIEKDSVEQDHVHWLIIRVATELINCKNKDAESNAEVVLLGSVFDPKICHRVISSLVGQLMSEGLLNICLLQGLMQLIQEASPDSLIDDDLVRILRVLREQLTKTYKALGNTEHAASNHIYQLSTIVCRILDAMMERDIGGLSRAEDHKPLLDLLVELKGSPDPYLKFQASYAWQALQYAGDDEPPLHAVLRIGGGVTMAALSVASVFKFDLENLFKGLDTLAQAAGQAYDVVKAGVEGAQALRKGGEGAMYSLLKGFQSGSKRTWYPALQAARMCVRDGRLADFQQLIYEAPCRREPEFQWGVCQLLGEIAMDPIWADESRQQAANLLGKLYRSDKEWITDAGAKETILGILQYISTEPDQIIRDHTKMLIQDLPTGSISNLPRAYPLTVRMSLPVQCSLLDKALKDSALEYELHKMMAYCHKEYRQSVYIPPQAKANLLAADKDSFPLMDKVKEFLSSNRKVFLVLGDSGAGKSTFNRHLGRVLCTAYKPGDQIPLFINLPSLMNPEKKLITEHLKHCGFSKAAGKELKQDRQFILICDGYDEARLSINLHSSNMFNRPQQWKVKMIINCRSTYIDQGYRAQFRPQPVDKYSSATHHLFQEATIIPFSRFQIEDYVGQVVQETKVHELPDDRSIWDLEKYMDVLKAIPNLMELVKNPFLLALSLKVLPTMAKDSPDYTKVKLTRLYIYDAFICQWAHDGFSQAVIDFLKDLAAAIFQEQDGYPSVEYTQRRHGGSWKNKFFGIDIEPTFLRQSSPLARIGIRHSFIHHSLLEYFYSRHIYETSKIISMSDVSQDLVDHPLSQRDLVKEPSIIQFLVEYVQGELGFKQQLYQIIQRSKADITARQAAANAITILVRAGVSFIRADLKGIQISGADLSGGQFDSAQMQGAALRSVNLRNIWLRQADLSNAQMAGVQFGELPYLNEENMGASCAYSPDGTTFVVGLGNGDISLYNTSTWEKTCVLNGHNNAVEGIVFSPNGRQIASGSWDRTVRIWDAQTGAPSVILSDHTREVTAVVFSPNGEQIASGSQDNMVRLWDAQTGVPGVILAGHTDYVTSVVFSPSSHQIASSSQDETVRLWDVQAGVPSSVQSGHTKQVKSVVFSPSGQNIASGSEDKMVRLWDAQTGIPDVILCGHTDCVTSVVFSPSGQHIASGSWDRTLRLWDAQTGVPGAILSGHSREVTTVVFSPSGDQIASGSKNNMVRLWNAQTGAPGAILSGHTERVTSVVFSPSGQQIASGSEDGTERLWHAQTSALVSVLHGHFSCVTSVAFSPSGQQIASGSWDNTVRIWDAQTDEPVMIISGHSWAVTSVVFSPGGQ